MEQAVISIDGQTFGKTFIPDAFTEKFAELIVRECAQDFDNTYMSGGKTMGAYIREKFGVEE
jgi:hypothetical protein